MTYRFRCFCAALLCVAIWPAPPALAADEPAIWEYQGTRGTIRLLGSVHLLRRQDYPLPASIDRAYQQADTLVMEVDLDDLDPLGAQMLMVNLSMLQDGRTLGDVMGSADYRKARRRASELGVDLQMLERVEPWFAALTIMNLQLLKLGFDPQIGLEQHLSGKARRDGKQVIGLETLEFQLGIFDAMPLRTQSRLLLQTLDEAATIETQMATLVSAWRRGDSARLAREMGRNFEGYPDVYRKLVSDRNRSWVRQIQELGASEGNYLVVVGALHLVGEDGVIALLQDRGGKIRRWPATR